ncbi:serine hydrolase [Kitasatospora sp. NA04385]|uniref:serine hydrolase n=1 Tax=Kitasatospora sp. NA04385 TaxID=2742135 RepID=UPI00158FA037|nr:serine hydrolase [Kitasatospora sp. NA04385]QKW23890.1 serine hydrolase [Kitasatospora sp. NA04385]
MTAPPESRTSARRQERRSRRTRRIRRAVVVAVALSALGSWLVLSRPTAGAPASAAASAAVSSSEPTADGSDDADGSQDADDVDDGATQDAAAAALGSALDNALNTLDGHFAVTVTDPASGASAAWGEDSFVTASIVKVDILAALLLQNDGVLSSTQKAAAALMIEQSDNTAATTLFEAVGGASGLDAANAAFGLTGTVAGTDGFWGLTETTAADQARLLRVVFTEDSPLGPSSRAYLAKLMGLVADDQDWGVSAADQGGAVQLKNGWLPRDSTGLWVVNSIGRIEYGGRSLLVSVLSDGSASEEAGIALVESVASAAVRAFAAAA